MRQFAGQSEKGKIMGVNFFLKESFTIRKGIIKYALLKGYAVSFGGEVRERLRSERSAIANM